MISETQINKIKAKHQELEQQLGDPVLMREREKYAMVNREYNELTSILEHWQEIHKLKSDLTDFESQYKSETDTELKKLISEEIANTKSKLAEQEKILEEYLKPQDTLDNKNIIIEIRAGTGGDEAALFAASLFRMYSRYAERQGWSTNLLSANRSDIGGYKEIIFEIVGRKVYSQLKWESGVHRVQRIPTTEKSGRVHTSTATVAVLPEA